MESKPEKKSAPDKSWEELCGYPSLAPKPLIIAAALIAIALVSLLGLSTAYLKYEKLLRIRSADSVSVFYTIHQIRKSDNLMYSGAASPARTYRTEGYLNYVSIRPCPPCPKAGLCSPCATSFILIGEKPNGLNEESQRRVNTNFTELYVEISRYVAVHRLNEGDIKAGGRHIFTLRPGQNGPELIGYTPAREK